MTENGRGQLLKHKANGVYTPTTELIKPRWGRLLTVSCFAMTIGTGIPVGYQIGVLNSLSEYMKEWCSQTLIYRYDLHLTESQLLTLWASIVSIFLVGGCVGSLFGASFADRFGRKGSLLICGIGFAISAVIFYFTRIVRFVELLLLGRFIVGLASGLTTAVLAMYLAEIAPPELRGTLATFSGLGVTAGVVVAQVASLAELLGTEDLWHYALSAYIILVVVCFIPYPWYPESPKYLYIVADNRELARNELLRLRVGDSREDVGNRVNSELLAMEQESQTQAETRSIWSVLTDPTLLMPIILICALQGGQQLSGINAVFYYSVGIFTKAGLSDTAAKWANFGAGSLNLLVALFSPWIMSKFDRRPITMLSCLFSGFFLVMLAFVVHFTNTFAFLSLFSVFAVFAYIFAFQIGLGPVPYFIGSELVEIAPRPAAMSLGSLASWACNFTIGMAFPSLAQAIGSFVFLPFAVVCFGLVALVFRYLPETRGKEPADVAPLVSRGFSSRRF